MEKELVAIAGAVAGVAAATAAALVIRKAELEKIERNHIGEKIDIERSAYAKGWIAGADKTLRELKARGASAHEVFPSLS